MCKINDIDSSLEEIEEEEAITTTETLSSTSTNTFSYPSTISDASVARETPPNQTSNLSEASAAIVTTPTAQTLVPSQILNLSAALDISEIMANNYSNDDLKNLLCIALTQHKKLSDQLNQQRDE